MRGEMRSVRLSQLLDHNHGTDRPPVGHMAAVQHRKRPARAALVANGGCRAGHCLLQQPRLETRQLGVRRQVEIAFVLQFFPQLSTGQVSWNYSGWFPIEIMPARENTVGI